MSFLDLVGWLVAAATLYNVASIIYNAYFHPLSSYPGPFWWRVSRIPICLQLTQGTLPWTVLALHDRYGDVVRLTPNELSFRPASAWKDIYGRRPEMEKERGFYRPDKSIPKDIVTCESHDSRILRRQIAPAFTNRALQEQEGMVSKYTDMLMTNLHSRGNGGKTPIDLAAWFNFTTFDTIGDLAFAEPFGCLEKGAYHPWVQTILDFGRMTAYSCWATSFPLLGLLMKALIPASIVQAQRETMAFTKRQLRRRVEIDKGRPDLVHGLIESGMDQGNLEANAAVVVMAGSESSATALAGAVYYLTSNPEALRKLTAEVREAFIKEADICFQSVVELRYLQACIDEALRLYPPVATGLPRVVPKGGENVAGHFVPEGNIVAIHHWATFHSGTLFKDPHSFRPERWLGDEAFAGDELDAVQTFHPGPRSCVGKKLAMAEMRVILARILWAFDLRRAEESDSWLEQKSFFFWEKGPLMVHLTPARR